MKNLSLVILLFASLFSTSLFSQNWSLGPTAGVNVSNISGDGTSELSYTPGFIGGLVVNYSSISHSGVSGKVLFAQYGAENDTRNTKTVLNYLQIPVYGVYYFGNQPDHFRPKIYIGPYVSFLLSAKDGAGTDLDPNGTTFNNIDGGAIGGVGFNYRLTRGVWLNADMRYTLGLADINKLDAVKNYNHGLAVMLGVAFALTPEAN